MVVLDIYRKHVQIMIDSHTYTAELLHSVVIVFQERTALQS